MLAQKATEIVLAIYEAEATSNEVIEVRVVDDGNVDWIDWDLLKEKASTRPQYKLYSHSTLNIRDSLEYYMEQGVFFDVAVIGTDTWQDIREKIGKIAKQVQYSNLGYL